MGEPVFAETPFWQQPPTRSAACARILERIEAGRWKPAESTLWRRHDEAAKRAKVHEWEWRNLILHTYLGRLAAALACPWPIDRVPHCPAPVYEPAADRYDPEYRFLQALCACPEPDLETWPTPFYHRVHWVTSHYRMSRNKREKVRLYCACGPRDDPPGSGNRWINDDGYVCEHCAPLLVTSYSAWGSTTMVDEAGHVGEGPCWSHQLKCDCRCCYCGNVARERRGWRLNCHPPIAKV